MIIVDIIVTACASRPHLLRQSLKSLKENTDKDLYRLTVTQDGQSSEVARICQEEFSDIVDFYFYNKENIGLGPSLNHTLNFILGLNKYYNDLRPGIGELDKVTSMISINQEDLQYNENWLTLCLQKFLSLQSSYNLAVVSGLECPEHAVEKDLGNGVLIKKWVRMAHMMAPHAFFEATLPIPIFDIETGKRRARPHDGMGSSVDWFFIRDHENSVTRSGKNCLVLPGVLQHSGYQQSTWLKRELPESETDKQKIKEASLKR